MIKFVFIKLLNSDILIKKTDSDLVCVYMKPNCDLETLFVYNHRVLQPALQWRHNRLDGVSNHQHHACLLNGLFGHRSKKTSNIRVTGLCERNSPVTGEFSAQRTSNAKSVSIWWRHHGMISNLVLVYSNMDYFFAIHHTVIRSMPHRFS